MTTTPHRIAGRLSVALLALGVPAAHAQAPAEVDTLALPGDTPTVPPTNIRLPLRDIPASVTIVTAETLAIHGYQAIGEAVRQVAGAGHNRLAGANYDLRVSSKRVTSPPRVTVLVDGVEVGGESIVEDDAWSDLPVSVDDVERVEVTIGAGTAGFGRASRCVVINIVTKHPADVEQGYGRLNVGSSDAVRATARAGLTIGPSAFRLAVQHHERTRDDDRAGSSRSGAYGIDRVTLRSATAFGDNASLAVDAAYLSGQHDPDPFADPPQGSQEVLNGYASMLWTQNLSPVNQWVLRLDQWTDSERMLGAGCTDDPPGDCDALHVVEHRTRLEVHDMHVFSETLRVVGGIGVNQALVHRRDVDALQWSARYRRMFGDVHWNPHPQWALDAGFSDADAEREVHDRVWHAGANHHLTEDQTLRLAWSWADWASDQASRLALADTHTVQERTRIIELGYLVEPRNSSLSANARLFWNRLEGQLWNSKSGVQPAFGEFYGVELRTAGALTPSCNGYVAVTTTSEGSNSSGISGKRPRPWGGGVGLAFTAGDSWQFAADYYASSQAKTSTQTAGRLDLTALKDFRALGARWRATLNLRQADHVRRDSPDGKTTLTLNALRRNWYASLGASF